MKKINKSIWIIHCNFGGCSRCCLELRTKLFSEIASSDVNITGNPKHADVLLVTGSVNNKSSKVLKEIYSQIPDPKSVIAIGECASGVNLFCNKNTCAVDEVISVDVQLNECIPTKPTLLEAVIEAGALLNKTIKSEEK